MRHCARADYLDFLFFVHLFLQRASFTDRLSDIYCSLELARHAYETLAAQYQIHMRNTCEKERERELITEFTISLSIRELCGWSANISARYYYWFQYRQPYNSNIISVRGVMDIGNINLYDKNSSTPWIVPKNASPTKFCFDDGMN